MNLEDYVRYEHKLSQTKIPSLKFMLSFQSMIMGFSSKCIQSCNYLTMLIIYWENIVPVQPLCLVLK